MIRRGRGRPRKIQPQQQENIIRNTTVTPPPPLKRSNGGFPAPAPEVNHLKRSSSSSSRGHMFFKIMHSDIIQDRQLGIPMKFLRKFTKDLSDVAILKAPRGPIWHVELKKGHRGDVCFRNGWPAFVDYHSISHGYFLVFRYDGNSQFHVLIFDLSGGEIDYRLSTTTAPNNFQEHGISHSRSSIMKVTKEIVEELEQEEEEEEEEEYMKNFGVSPISESFPNRKASTTKPVIQKKSRREINFSPAMQAAKEFKSKNLFFTVHVAPAYVNHYFMPVPSRFVKRLLPDTRGWVKVRVSDGRSWFISCTASETEKKFRLNKGITAFLRDNNVKIGDFCVFELITENCAILQAHIFHRGSHG